MACGRERLMKRTSPLMLIGLTGVLALGVCTPRGFADDDSRQQNKNTWRNLAIGAGVIGVHGLIQRNPTEAIIGIAGSAYSANRYEQDRRSQSEAARERAEYHRRSSDRRYYWYNGHEYYQDLNTAR